MEPLPKYLDAIKNFPTPTRITDIRSWFGLVNEVAHYVQLREMLEPFKSLLSPKNKFQWNDELQSAFDEYKLAIIEAIKEGIEIFEPDRFTAMRTDYSETGLGYYLMQKHCECPEITPMCCTDGWRITLCSSRFLKGPELRYGPVEGECLAIVWDLDHSRYFTLGCDKLQIVTDHKPIVKIFDDRLLDEIPNTKIFKMKQATMP